MWRRASQRRNHGIHGSWCEISQKCSIKASISRKVSRPYNQATTTQSERRRTNNRAAPSVVMKKRQCQTVRQCSVQAYKCARDRDVRQRERNVYLSSCASAAVRLRMDYNLLN